MVELTPDTKVGNVRCPKCHEILAFHLRHLNLDHQARLLAPPPSPSLETLARETAKGLWLDDMLASEDWIPRASENILSALSNLDRCHLAECQACRTLREHEDVDWVVKLREKDAQVAYEQERNANNTAMAEHMLGERDAEITRLTAELQTARAFADENRETINAQFAENIRLIDAPEPYSESNQPQVEDVVQTPTGLVGHISKIEGKMIWVSRTFDSEVRSSFWTVNNLILLYRPPQPGKDAK